MAPVQVGGGVREAPGPSRLLLCGASPNADAGPPYGGLGALTRYCPCHVGAPALKFTLSCLQ